MRDGLEPGSRLNERYEIVSQLGKGGFSAVYEANDVWLCRRVAVKVLSGSEVEAENRFTHEARVAARLEHPNIVRIYDYGFHQHQPYLVMERLSGRPLSRYLKRHGALDVAHAMSLIVSCLHGLSEAHRQGVVHRDLTPGNLFLHRPAESDERLVILDFGLAISPLRSRMTRTGIVVGTPRYIAPEYLRSLEATPATDVYQLGLILIEMCAGNPAVPALDVEACFAAHEAGDLDIPESLLDGPIGKLVLKAVSRDPRKRFADASEFQLALESHLERARTPAVLGPITAELDGVDMHSGKTSRRRARRAVALPMLNTGELNALKTGERRDDQEL